MENRPNLNRELDEKTFREYYYLKEELITFCRENHLPVSGGKLELTERVAYFLRCGKVLKTSNKKKHKTRPEMITEDTRIEENITYSEQLRAFFVERIGKSFSFNVPFQKWLKSNVGKTYKEAVMAYHQLLKEKKKSKGTIDQQFEYNTYIRDFFQDNLGRSLKDAIQCWNYKKGLKGNHRYEKSDLIALDDDTIS